MPMAAQKKWWVRQLPAVARTFFSTARYCRRTLPERVLLRLASAASSGSKPTISTSTYWTGERNQYRVAETLEAFQALKRAGKIRDYGVSNFDQDEMEEVRSLS